LKKKKRGYHHFLGNRGSISLKKLRIALIFDTGKHPKTTVITTIKSKNSFINVIFSNIKQIEKKVGMAQFKFFQLTYKQNNNFKTKKNRKKESHISRKAVEAVKVFAILFLSLKSFISIKKNIAKPEGLDLDRLVSRTYLCFAFFGFLCFGAVVGVVGGFTFQQVR
jgi:hypothetical protein